MKTLKFKDIFKADDENDKTEDDTIESVEPDSLLHESFIEEAKNTIEKCMIDLEESNTNEDLPNSEDDDEENLNAENNHRKIFEELQCNFFRPSLNHNNLKIFRQERKNLKLQKEHKMPNMMVGVFSSENHDPSLTSNYFINDIHLEDNTLIG